jgi:D-glycero-alpha-D-manno-heptose-7-phosphate kinase
VVTAAIDKYVYIGLNHRKFDNDLRIATGEFQHVTEINQLADGIVRECLLKSERVSGIDISSFSDLPFGSGIGSSGSFSVGLLHALYTLGQRASTHEELAADACEIEGRITNGAVGVQDQYISSLGGIKCLTVRSTGEVLPEDINIPPGTMDMLSSNIMIFYTGIRRNSAEVLRDQNDACLEGNDRVMANLDEIKQIGLNVKDAIEKGNLTRFAELLDSHWMLKRGLSSQVSTSEIDRLYALGKANGAIGGKILGAGRGGFLMFYCDFGHDRLIQAMEHEGLVYVPFRFDFEGSKVLVE